MTVRPQRTWTLVGWAAVAFFVGIYVIELFPHHGPPVIGRWMREHLGRGGLIGLNIAIVLAFLALLPYRRPTRHVWRSHGTFAAFVIALMTEMFGRPLVVFLLSPVVSVPPLAPAFFEAVGHWPARVGTGVSFAGLVVVALGWRQTHRADGLVTTGIYRYLRHPQYAGILLFALGWLLHWPTVVTLLLWPLLVGAYAWLARLEERQALEDFGQAYADYAAQTKRFLPGLI